MNRARSPHATIFGTAADAYARYRPRPAGEALDWLLAPGDHDIADVGAGTGQLTRLLVERGASVTAIEPDQEMRRVLAAGLPGVRVIRGVAEELPLAAGSQDVVLSHAAEHWFDPRRAVPEAARVLRRGGRLGALSTGIDSRVEWVGELWNRLEPDPAARRPGGREAGRGRRGQAKLDRLRRARLFGAPGAPFRRQERYAVPFTRQLKADDLLGLAQTYSGWLVQAPDEQAERLEAARALLQARFGGQRVIEVPMMTRCWRAEVRRR